MGWSNDETPASGLKAVTRFQGLYYVVTGAWPALHRRSFEALTGAKTDYWLVAAFGVLAAAVGGVLLLAARSGRITREIVALGAGSAVVMVGCDILAGIQPCNTAAYFADAILETFLVAWWVMAARRTH